MRSPGRNGNKHKDIKNGKCPIEPGIARIKIIPDNTCHISFVKLCDNPVLYIIQYLHEEDQIDS